MWRKNSQNANEISDREFEKKVRAALNNKDVVAFKRLLKGGIDVNAKYWFNSTLLHDATQMGHEEFVEILLKVNANVDAGNKSGRTPLHIAARSGNVAIVTMLLKSGADVNGRVKSEECSSSSSLLAGQSPLHVALWRGKDQVVRLLLEAGADVNVLDQDGWMPVHWAAKLNYVNVLKELIRKGSYIDNPTAKTHKTPLLQSLINSNIDSTIVLVLHGADVHKSLEGKSGFSYLLDDRYTPAKKKLEVAWLFLNCGLGYETVIKHSEQLKKLENQSECVGISRLSETPVQPLSCLCRSQIRKCFTVCSRGKSIYYNLQKLSIPKILIDFLTFSDDYKQVYFS